MKIGEAVKKAQSLEGVLSHEYKDAIATLIKFAQESEYYVPADNGGVIRQLWATIQERGHKPVSLYYKLEEMHKKKEINLTLNDLIEVSDRLGYKGLWATFKAQDLGIIEAN